MLLQGGFITFLALLKTSLKEDLLEKTYFLTWVYILFQILMVMIYIL